MGLCRRLLCLLVPVLLPAVVFAQAPPPKYTDGTVTCRPAYSVQVLPGSLACGTDPEGLPSAVYDPVGATPGTTAFTNILSGTSPGALLISNSLGTTAGGVINYSAGTINFPLLTHTGMDTSKMYVGDVTNQVKIVDILSCDAITEKIRWTGDNWECVTDQGGVAAGQVRVTPTDTTTSELDSKLVVDGSMSKAVLNPGANETLQLSATPPLGNVTPGNNTQAGTFQFSGPALFRVDSQIRIPASTTAPLVDNELKVDTDADGTVIAKPMLTYQSGGTDFTVPATAAPPAAQLDVLTYNLLGQDFIWQRPATVCVSAVDTTCNYLANKLVAGANITLTPSGAGNETLTIASTGGGASDFGSLTSGTNTQAAMTVGTGASMGTSGTGTIAATTAAAAAATPGLCPAGQYARGVDANFAGTGCTTPAGGGLGTNLSSATNDITSDNGTIRFGGAGATNNESLDWDFETTANQVTVTSTTGVDTVQFPGIAAAGAGPGSLRLFQTGGGNYIDILAPATVTSNRTCQLEDDATPFDQCITPGGGTDELVKVSGVDTTAGFLSAKLVAGANITLTPSGAGNETLTVASTAGAPTTTERPYFDAASCQDATATRNFDDDPNATEPTPACLTLGAKTFGVADFADDALNCVMRSIALPSDVTDFGAFSANYVYRTAATTGSVRWTIQTMCEANGEDAATFNPVGANDATTDPAAGLTNSRNVASMSNITMTGCANLEQLYFRVCRDGGDAADTLGGVARLQGVEITFQRTH